MKTRPIIFQPDSVRAIFGGRKSQTRRIVNIRPGDHFNTNKIEVGMVSGDKGEYYGFTSEEYDYKCPYGVPGDRLWVRESWCVHARYDGLRPKVLPEIKYLQNAVTHMADVYKAEKSLWMGKTRPSIFMPRKYSRLTLEITNIRVERVQDISTHDAYWEGVEDCDVFGHDDCFYGTVGRVCSFERLWDKMHGKKYPWSSNPWVWVIEFKKEP